MRHPHHPQLKRFGTGRLTLVVPTLSVEHVGRTKVNLPMPNQAGIAEVSLPDCFHLLYRGGTNNTSGMQIISSTFYEIYSGELQITCTKSTVWSCTLIL